LGVVFGIYGRSITLSYERKTGHIVHRGNW